MKYIICQNIEEFNLWNDKIHNHRLLTVSNFSDEKWSEPITGIDGKILCPILEGYVEILTADAKDISEIDRDNYFPKVDSL